MHTTADNAAVYQDHADAYDVEDERRARTMQRKAGCPAPAEGSRSPGAAGSSSAVTSLCATVAGSTARRSQLRPIYRTSRRQANLQNAGDARPK